MKLKFLILSISFLLLHNCSNNDDDTFTPTLPPITQIGANTFGVYIDGKLLVPRDGDGTFNLPSYAVEYFGTGNVPTDYNSSLTINDYKGGNAGLLQLVIEDVQNGEGEYQIKESNCQECGNRHCARCGD